MSYLSILVNMTTECTAVAGIDEAGRGAFAGPVVAGACILPASGRIHPLIKDSKALSPLQREKAFVWIAKHCVFGVGRAEAEEVDAIGIIGATEKAMQQAVAMLAQKTLPTYLIIDGRDKFWFDYPHSSVINGDRLEPCISAASIVAKVMRDRWMVEYAKTFSQYGFEGHKGYGAPSHIQAIQTHGPCLLHRRTFIRRLWSTELKQDV